MDAFLQDIRYGVRQLLRQRGSSIIAVLTLALGIGPSTAIFSVIDATMLRPLPYPDPEQLVTLRVAITKPDGQVSSPTASMADMRMWQQADDVVSKVAARGSAFGGRIVDGLEPARIEVSQFTEDYLSIHGVTPLIGRDFTFEDTQFGAPAVALLGYGYWQSRYAGRRDVIGETLRLDDGGRRSSASCQPPSTRTFRSLAPYRFHRKKSTGVVPAECPFMPGCAPA